MEDRYLKLRRLTGNVCVLIVIGLVAFGAIIYYTSYTGLSGVRPQIFWRFIFGAANIGNVISVAGMWFAIESPNVKMRWKNLMVVEAMLLIVFFTATAYQRFPAGLCMFGIPILFSAIFVDRILTRLSAVSAIILCGLSYLIGAFSSSDVYRAPKGTTNYGIAVMCIVICYLLSDLFFYAYKENLVKITAGAADNESLEKKLERDPMTGLYNHSAFYAHLDRLVKERNDEPLSLAVVDIDNFKRINDTYGHNNGDEVILNLASIMKEICDDGNNYVCRYGGEEFAVIFPNVKVKQAKESMETVLEKFRNCSYEWLDGNITFSCGIFQLSTYRMSSVEFFQVADKMLYQAKHSGKNQCVSG